jgi:hypothetical protein
MSEANTPPIGLALDVETASRVKATHEVALTLALFARTGTLSSSGTPVA